jgi:drug/metabolite transporter (DMT)-like permease
MTWFFLTLAAALCWGFAQVLIKKGFDHLPPLWNNIFNNGLSLFVWVFPILFISRSALRVPSREVLLIIFCASALYHIFFYAISRGQISITGTVIAGYPLITIALSHLFLAELLRPLQYIGIICILSGSVIVAFREKSALRNPGDLSWIPWGFAGAVTIGAGDFLSKLSIDAVGPFSHMMFLAFISNGVSLFNYTLDRKNRYVPDIFHQKLFNSIGGLILNLVGVFLFYMAFQYGKLSLVIGVSSIYPAFMVIFALKMLKETLTSKQIAGIGTTITGLLIVGFGS